MNFNIAVIHAGASAHAEAVASGAGGRVVYPGFGRVYSSLGESVVTQWGSANVIWLQVSKCSNRDEWLFVVCDFLDLGTAGAGQSYELVYIRCLQI